MKLILVALVAFQIGVLAEARFFLSGDKRYRDLRILPASPRVVEVKINTPNNTQTLECIDDGVNSDCKIKGEKLTRARGLSDEDHKALAWAKKHPNDPRSEQILAIIAAQNE